MTTGRGDHRGSQYEIAALIARPTVLRRVELAYPMCRVVALSQGLALIPLGPELMTALEAGSGDMPISTGFARLSPGLHALLTSTSHVGPIGMFEAVSLGGEAWQTAAVWSLGDLDYGPEVLHRTEPGADFGDGPFSAALRALGASAIGRQDELVAVGLDRVRRTEDWV